MRPIRNALDCAKLRPANSMFNDAITHKKETTAVDLSLIMKADIRASLAFESGLNGEHIAKKP